MTRGGATNAVDATGLSADEWVRGTDTTFVFPFLNSNDIKSGLHEYR